MPSPSAPAAGLRPSHSARLVFQYNMKSAPEVTTKASAKGTRCSGQCLEALVLSCLDELAEFIHLAVTVVLMLAVAAVLRSLWVSGQARPSVLRGCFAVLAALAYVTEGSVSVWGATI